MDQPIDDLIRLLAEAPPEERVLPDPVGLMQASQFLRSTQSDQNASSAGPASAERPSAEPSQRGETASTPAAVAERQTFTSSVATPTPAGELLGASASAIPGTRVVGAAAGPSERGGVSGEPAVPTPPRSASTPQAGLSRHDWFSEEPANPRPRSQEIGPAADLATNRLVDAVPANPVWREDFAGTAAEALRRAESQYPGALVVSPEYMVGQQAVAELARQQTVRPAETADSPVFVSSQMTPTHRVEFVVPAAMPVDPVQLFAAADKYTMQTASAAAPSAPYRDLFTGATNARVQPTAEAAAQHFVDQQPPEYVDRRSL